MRAQSNQLADSGQDVFVTRTQKSLLVKSTGLEDGVEDETLVNHIAPTVEEAEQDKVVGHDRSILVLEDARCNQFSDPRLILLELAPGRSLEDSSQCLESHRDTPISCLADVFGKRVYTGACEGQRELKLLEVITLDIWSLQVQLWLVIRATLHH